MIRVFVCLATIFLTACSSLAKIDTEHEKALTEIATGNCEGEFLEGKDYRVVSVEESEAADVEYLNQGIVIRVEDEKEWREKQRVAEADALPDKINFTKCKDKELAWLRENISKPTDYGMIILGGVAAVAAISLLANSDSDSDPSSMQSDGTNPLTLTVPTP